MCNAFYFEERAFSKKIGQWDLPLKTAYQFAAANGLGVQAGAIRKKSLRWKSRTSAVRAGYMILLLQSKGLFEKFQKEYWRTMRQKEAKKSIAIITGWF